MVYYALDADGTVRPVGDSRDATWAIDHRRIDRTTVNQYDVSTVFLGVDHGFGGGPPLLFETMVFDDTAEERYADLYCERYSTKAEAQAGHDRVVAALQAGKDPGEIGGDES